MCRDRGMMGRMRFDLDELLAEARASTDGLEDFGSGGFREGLEALGRTYRDAPLSEGGARRSRRRLVTLLATRLRVEAAFRRHPSIRRRRIERPIVLTGLPRTGTSALLNLLARNPVTRPLLYWETSCPDPLEPPAPPETDPRRRAIAEMLERHRVRNPDFDSIHFAGADTPEECVLLQAHGFHGVQLGVEVLWEPYASFFRNTKPDGMYAYYADLLRLLDWQRPGERWLLKSPAHLWALDELVAVFPDVGIVWSHRDPLDVIPSAASITLAVARTMMTDVDPLALGPRVLEHYACSLERGVSSRAALDPAGIVDVDHQEIVESPLATAERVSRHLGLPIDAAARATMETHVAHHPRDRHGRHDYDLARFGLDEASVRSRFEGSLSELERLRARSREAQGETPRPRAVSR